MHLSTKENNFIVLFILSLIIVLALSTLEPSHAQEATPVTGRTAVEAIELTVEGLDEVEPIVEEGDYAYGGWSAGEMGGVAIAQREDRLWRVICSTGGVYQPQELMQFCEVPAEIAQKLWDKWIEATGEGG